MWFKGRVLFRTPRINIGVERTAPTLGAVVCSLSNPKEKINAKTVLTRILPFRIYGGIAILKNMFRFEPVMNSRQRVSLFEARSLNISSAHAYVPPQNAGIR